MSPIEIIKEMDGVSGCILLVISFLMVLCCIVELKKKVSTKSVILSLGIVGTFIGIVWGLYNFDTTDTDGIQKSIGNLLNGLKTAFLTSILGMIISITLSIKDIFFGSSETEEKEIDKLKEIVDLLKTNSPTNGTKDNFKALASSINNLAERMDHHFNGILEEFRQITKSQIVYTEQLPMLSQSVKEIRDMSIKIEKVFSSFDTILDNGLNKIENFSEEVLKNLDDACAQFKHSGDGLTRLSVDIEKFSESMQTSIRGQSQSLNTLSQDLINDTDILKQTHQELDDILNAQFEAFRKAYLQFKDAYLQLTGNLSEPPVIPTPPNE